MNQMRTVAFAACAAAAMIVPTASHAQGMGGPGGVSYLGGSVGQSIAQDFCTATTGAICSDNCSADAQRCDTTWSVFIGHQVNRHLAIELGYRDLGKMAVGVPGAETSINAKAFELLAVGILPIGDRFSLYGKFGAYFGETHTVTESPLGTGSGKDSNINLTYGLGAEWEFVKQFRLRLEWQRYQDMSRNDIDFDAVSVGLVYRFR